MKTKFIEILKTFAVCMIIGVGLITAIAYANDKVPEKNGNTTVSDGLITTATATASFKLEYKGYSSPCIVIKQDGTAIIYLGRRCGDFQLPISRVVVRDDKGGLVTRITSEKDE